MRKSIFFAAIMLTLVLSVSIAYGDIPPMINYQGYLTDPDGNPVPDGAYSLTFGIYDAQAGGQALWSETQGAVQVVKGLFNVLLGGVNPITLAFDRDYWLVVQIGTEAELSPRIRLTSVGYSFRANFALDADMVDGKHASAFLSTANDWGRSGVATNLYEGKTKLTDKYVNKGQVNPVTTEMIVDSAVTAVKIAVPLDLSGTVAGPKAIISGTNTSGSGIGVKGSNNAHGYLGYLGADNCGVYGKQTVSRNYGYLGSVDYGVYGKHYSSGNEGRIGSSAHGVYGKHNSKNFGYLGGSLYSVYGKHFSSGNEGHIGGSDLGVYGRHNSGDYGYLGGSNRGVYGSSSSGIGVYGRSSGSGTGVRGSSSSGTGVYGKSSSANAGLFENTDPSNDYSTLYAKTNGSGWAVHAQSTHSTGHAGYFDGNVQVTGSLSVNGPALGFFPRPAWNSGWVYLSQGEEKILTHNVGGDPEDYFVDFQCLEGGGMGIHISRIGGNKDKYKDLAGYFYFTRYYGAYYHSLTSSTVKVKRHGDDDRCPKVRVRIWVIK